MAYLPDRDLAQLRERQKEWDERAKSGVWIPSRGLPICIALPLPGGAILSENDGKNYLYMSLNQVGYTVLDGSLAEVAEKLGLPAPPEGK